MDVERVIEDLKMLAEFYEDKSKCCGIDRNELLNEAIQIIEDLQDKNK